MIWLYTIISGGLISVLSLVGALVLAVNKEKLGNILIYFVSFSVGALFGDVFIHIIPEISAEGGFDLTFGLYFLLGVMIFFVIEQFIHWHHCHKVEHHHKIKPFAYTNLIGDGLHNLLDGMIVAASFMVSIPVGMATTLAVIFHEIPQEIGDFGVLLYAGFKKKTALLFNFASAFLAVIGAVLTLIFLQSVEGLELIVLAIAGGGFLYIAGSDLMPELQRHEGDLMKSFKHFIMILLGILVMVVLTFVG